MSMIFMLMLFLHIRIVYGGTGVIIMDGDGDLLGIIAVGIQLLGITDGMILGTMEAGMEAGIVVGTVAGEATGAGAVLITTIMQAGGIMAIGAAGAGTAQVK